MSLSREEIARAKFTFSIYDFEGINKIDAFQLGNALRALNLTPTLNRIDSLGGTKHRNQKTLTVEEFLAIYQEVKNDKPEGCMEDFMECFACYDKDKTGRLEPVVLAHLLQSYGEDKLDRDEAEEIIEECGDPDYDGLIDYKDFLNKLLKGPELKIPIAMLYAAEKESGSSPTENGDAADVEMNIAQQHDHIDHGKDKVGSGSAGVGTGSSSSNSNSDSSRGEFSNARNFLQSSKSNSKRNSPISQKVQQVKAAEESKTPPVKVVKPQQPLISLKTKGLFGQNS